jgi:chitodextrinase
MPADLQVTDAATTSVSLAWKPSSDDVAVKGYGVRVNGGSMTSTSQTNTTVGGLTCGSALNVAVDAFDAAGNRSQPAGLTATTTSCADSTPPSAPVNLQATSRTATSIAVSWSPSPASDGVAGYRLYRDGSSAGTTTTTSWIFSSLACNTNYTIAAEAYDAAGNRSPKTTVMISTTGCPDSTPPSTPSGLTVSAVTQTGLTLAWNPSTDNVSVTGYDVYRNNTKVGTVATPPSLQTGLACGTSYVFAVVARDAAGNTSPQGQVTASTAQCATTPPAAPPVAGWTGDFRAGGQDFSAFDTHDVNFMQFNDWAVGQTKDVTLVPKPSGSIYPWSNYMARVITNNSLPSNSTSGQTVNLWQPNAYGQPWVRGNTVWCRVILVIPDGTDPRYPGKLTPVSGDGVDNDFHVLAEWHKNDGAGAPGPTSTKLETAISGGKPTLIFKPIGGPSGNIRSDYLYMTDQVQTEANGIGGSWGPVGGNVVQLQFNHEYDLLFKWELDPSHSVGRIQGWIDGQLRWDYHGGNMFQKSDGSVPGLSFQAGMYRSYPSYGGRATDTTSANEHVYVVGMLTGSTRSSVGG